MKALTIRQPHATLVAMGVKSIETRSWATKYRGLIAIHAGAWVPPDGMRIDGGPLAAEYLVRLRSGIPRSRADRADLLDLNNQESHALRFGAVVCLAKLVDCLPMVESLGHPGDGTVDPPPSLLLDGLDGKMWLAPDGIDVEDQRPFGVFEPWMFAWVLESAEPFDDPIPAKGKQGLWNWDGVPA